MAKLGVVTRGRGAVFGAVPRVEEAAGGAEEEAGVAEEEDMLDIV